VICIYSRTQQVNEAGKQEGAVIAGAVIPYQQCELPSRGKEIRNITTTLFSQQLIPVYFQNMCAKVQVGKSEKHFVSFSIQGTKRGEKTCTQLKIYIFLQITEQH